MAISREDSIDIIKQVPLYRYECELEKGRQSDLFKALNQAISDMEKLQKIEEFTNQINENVASLGLLRASIREIKQILKEVE